jgi:hypothetical protein
MGYHTFEVVTELAQLGLEILFSDQSFKRVQFCYDIYLQKTEKVTVAMEKILWCDDN